MIIIIDRFHWFVEMTFSKNLQNSFAAALILNCLASRVGEISQISRKTRFWARDLRDFHCMKTTELFNFLRKFLHKMTIFCKFSLNLRLFLTLKLQIRSQGTLFQQSNRALNFFGELIIVDVFETYVSFNKEASNSFISNLIEKCIHFHAIW